MHHRLPQQLQHPPAFSTLRLRRLRYGGERRTSGVGSGGMVPDDLAEQGREVEVEREPSGVGGGVRRRGDGRRSLGVDDKVILTPPCIFCMENH